jgi:hypothetical protein
MYLQPWPECVSYPVWQSFLSERIFMDGLESVFLFLDYLTDTKRKRHLVGGVLMSVSLFFGGLAFTMMTIKGEETNEKTDA